VNKKLTGLSQKGSSIAKASVAPSFVQLRTAHRRISGKEIILRKVKALISNAGVKQGSTALTTLAMKVDLSEDHFVKVRGLIKDLLKKLAADAKAEATQKGECDTDMAKAISNRDEANGDLELATAKIASLTAKIQKLTDEISELNSQIADLKKALLEATELRAEDKAANEKAIEVSQDGMDAVNGALTILSKFYNSQFLQKGKYVPPNSDRSGKTVGDLAPDTFDSEYKGSQSESKGIIGILEVILSDFTRTNGKTKDEEKDSEDTFNEFEKDTNDDIKEKSDKIKKKEGQKTDAEDAKLNQEGEKSDAEKMLKTAEKTLEKLEAMCVEGEETWEERKKAREEEIEALKEALAILEDWKS